MKVLVSAYSYDPGKGSEPGAGWNWVLAAARDNDVWVITRDGLDNYEKIVAELKCRPNLSVEVVLVDLPRWARWRKPGQPGRRLYYAMWQLVALREAKRLHVRAPVRSRPSRDIRERVAPCSGRIRGCPVPDWPGRRRPDRAAAVLRRARRTRSRDRDDDGVHADVGEGQIPSFAGAFAAHV